MTPETECEESLRRELVAEMQQDLDLACEEIHGGEFRGVVTLPVCAIARLESLGEAKFLREYES